MAAIILPDSIWDNCSYWDMARDKIVKWENLIANNVVYQLRMHKIIAIIGALIRGNIKIARLQREDTGGGHQ